MKVAIPPIGGSALTEHYVYTNDQGEYRLGGVDPTKGQRLTVLGPDLLTAVNQTVQGTENQDLVADLVIPEVGQNLLNGTVFQPSETSQRIPTMAFVQVYGELPSLDRSILGLPQRTFLGERLSCAACGHLSCASWIHSGGTAVSPVMRSATTALTTSRGKR